MASSSHVRSVSLPSQPSHPLPFSTIQQQLHKLLNPTPPQSAEFLRHNIITLKALSRCIDDLLDHTQTSHHTIISHEPATSFAVENMLDASIKLLDTCSFICDILSRTKQSLRDLESSLRRWRSVDSCSLSSQVDAYLACRKGLSRLASKNVKIMEKDRGTSMSSEKMMISSSMVGDLVSLLREVEEVCVAEFKSLLCFVSGPRRSRSSVVLKLMHSKRGSEFSANVVGKIEADMLAMKSSRFGSAEQVEGLLRGLEGFGSSLEEAEVGLEGLFRRLLRTRVLLLNILSNN